MKPGDRQQTIHRVVNGWKRLTSWTKRVYWQWRSTRSTELMRWQELEHEEDAAANAVGAVGARVVCPAVQAALRLQLATCSSLFQVGCCPKPNFLQIVQRWGWCQWTADYGDEGPREDLPTTGYCNSNKDCVPRAPFCSRCVGEHFPIICHASLSTNNFFCQFTNLKHLPIISYGHDWVDFVLSIGRQGYCTQRPAPRGKHSGRQKNKTALDNRRTNQIGGRAQDRPHDRASQDHSIPEGRSQKRPQTRNHRTDDRGQQSQRRSQESRVAPKRPTTSSQAKPRPQAGEEPRARGVLPSGTFLLSQVWFNSKRLLHISSTQNLSDEHWIWPTASWHSRAWAEELPTPSLTCTPTTKVSAPFSKT